MPEVLCLQGYTLRIFVCICSRRTCTITFMLCKPLFACTGSSAANSLLVPGVGRLVLAAVASLLLRPCGAIDRGLAATASEPPYISLSDSTVTQRSVCYRAWQHQVVGTVCATQGRDYLMVPRSRLGCHRLEGMQLPTVGCEEAEMTIPFAV